MRVFSFGGGVQSTAVLALAAQDHVDFPVFLFANTGDDSENPDTLEYVRRYAMPFAAQHGIELHEINREWRDKRGWSLYDELMAPNKFTGIPIRLGASGVPGIRSCTSNYKIRVIARWLKRHGVSADNPGVVGLGISLDEYQRMRTSSGFDFYGLEYPLVDMRIDRSRCVGIIERAGLAVPPKSRCYFCPLQSLQSWRELRDKRPALFEQSMELERILDAKRKAQGKDGAYLTDKLKPLREAVGTGRQLNMLDTAEDACESGYCMT